MVRIVFGVVVVLVVVVVVVSMLMAMVFLFWWVGFIRYVWWFSVGIAIVTCLWLAWSDWKRAR